MELSEDPEDQKMIERTVPQTMQIDPRRARFPCCIVWTPLPVISWLIPFVGHIGICREDGVILDFAGPNFVCVDNFAFGAATRYIQISKEKVHVLSFVVETVTVATSVPSASSWHEFGVVVDMISPNGKLLVGLYGCCISPHPAPHRIENQYVADDTETNILTWDDALRKSTQEFQHRSYSLFTCNCHSFVANNLNRLSFYGGGWNVVNLAALIFLKGRWVSTTSIVKSFLPFAVVSGFGLFIGGLTFLTFWAFFTLLLVGWFFLGTYCFRNLIHL